MTRIITIARMLLDIRTPVGAFIVLTAICVFCSFSRFDSYLLAVFMTDAAFFIVLAILLAGLFKAQANLTSMCQISIISGTILALSVLIADINPTFIGNMIVGSSGLGLFFSLFATSILGLLRWRKTSHYWYLPFLICLCFLIIVRSSWFIPPIGNLINDFRFKRHFAEYTAVVDDIKAGIIPCTSSLRNIETSKIRDIPSGVIAIRAARADTTSLVVEFFWSSDKARVHAGYLFHEVNDSGGNVGIKIGTDQFFKVRHVVGNWYAFNG